MVTNKRRAEEDIARAILSEIYGVEVEHTDVNGEVDLSFTLPSGLTNAVEVTYLTSSETKRNDARWMRERAREYEATRLSHSWTLTVEKHRTEFKQLSERLEPHLAVLEEHGIDRADIWMRHRIDNPAVLSALNAIGALGGVQARVIAVKPSVCRIFFSPMAGWTAKGSDEALSIIEAYVEGREDNLDKLRAAGANRSHIFIWLDDDTDGAVARPFWRVEGSEAEVFDHFGLPTRPSRLVQPITDLWVVHERSGFGWRWDGVAWSIVDVSAQLNPTRHEAT